MMNTMMTMMKAITGNKASRDNSMEEGLREAGEEDLAVVITWEAMAREMRVIVEIVAGAMVVHRTME